MKIKEVKIKKIDNITITIRVSKLLKARMRLGLLLFRLAGWVLGCQVEIEQIKKYKSLDSNLPIGIDGQPIFTHDYKEYIK